jgi:AAA+ ATPase superfamily predicted ATPase
MIIIGPRGIGKSSLIMAFLKMLVVEERGVCPLYCDFEQIVSSPEEFAIQYIYQLLEGYLGLRGKTLGQGYTIKGLVEMGREVGSWKIDALISELMGELEQREIDRMRIVRLALSFPIELSSSLNKRLLLFVDEFPFLQDLDNFKGIDRVVDIFGASIEKGMNLSYVLTGSNVALMEELIRSNPYYKAFEIIYMGPLQLEEGVLLAKKTLSMEGFTLKHLFAQEIYDYASGHPYYIHSIARRVARKMIRGMEVGSGLIQDALAEEVVLQEGRINLFCRYIHDLSLERARSKSLLKAILYILTQKEGLSLSEIASLLKRSPGETSSLLHRLIEVDLIVKREGRYSIKDRILKYWLKYSGPIKVTEEEVALAKERLVHELKEEIKRDKMEIVVDVGILVETVKRSFRGQRLPGIPFGREMDVVFLEAHKISEVPFREGWGLLVEGTTSSQAITSLSISQSWLVVIWATKMVDVLDIEEVLRVKEEIQLREHIVIERLWIVSLQGFSEDALRLSREKRILFTDKDGWLELEPMLLEGMDQSSISK